jgi:hypothetical protein
MGKCGVPYYSGLHWQWSWETDDKDLGTVNREIAPDVVGGCGDSGGDDDGNEFHHH